MIIKYSDNDVDIIYDNINLDLNLNNNENPFFYKNVKILKIKEYNNAYPQNKIIIDFVADDDKTVHSWVSSFICVTVLIEEPFLLILGNVFYKYEPYKKEIKGIENINFKINCTNADIENTEQLLNMKYYKENHPFLFRFKNFSKFKKVCNFKSRNIILDKNLKILNITDDDENHLRADIIYYESKINNENPINNEILHWSWQYSKVMELELKESYFSIELNKVKNEICYIKHIPYE